jgi:hypothetical protein
VRSGQPPAVGTLSDLISRSRVAAALSVGLLGAAAISTQRDDIRCRNGRFMLSAGPRLPTRQVDIPPGDLG